jgi:hypothetical protein
MINTQNRYGNTGKKMITLTHEGREQIQTYADAHGMNFSATIESLALIGMEADLTKLLIPLLREVVTKALQRNFNRMAKLGLLAAAESAMAHDLAAMLLLQFVRLEAYRQADGFEDRMIVSRDPTDTVDARILALYEEMREVAGQRQQRLLKAPLRELVTRLAAEEIQNG